MVHQDYFIHFEPSQSLGGAKTGDPREKPPDLPQATTSRTWLASHVTHNGEMSSDLER